MKPIDLGIEPLVSLIPIGVLAGIGTLLVFRHASDQAGIRRAKNLVAAHLLELRLYMDEPRLILRAQRDLIVANARFLKLMLRPVLVMTLPMALLLALMDGFYGHAPLPADRSAIVTLQLKGAPSGPAPSLEPSPDVAVETPPVRAITQQQVSWRVRPLRESKGELRIVQNFRVVTKSIASGEGVRYLSERRGSFADMILHPTEWPLADSEIAWIEVRYPSARILHLHWLVWFLLISGIAALALRRRFRASF